VILLKTKIEKKNYYTGQDKNLTHLKKIKK